MAETGIRKYRVDDDTYTRAANRAAAEGTDVSKLIRQWLGDYADNIDALAYRPKATADSIVDQMAELLEQLRAELENHTRRRSA